MPHPLDSAFDNEMLIIKPVFAAAEPHAKEAQVIRGVMPAVSNPPAHEDRTLSQEKAGGIDGRIGQNTVDLSNQFGGEALIGIEVKNPGGPNRKILLRPIALSRIVFEGVLNEHDAGRSCDLWRSVGTEGIYDKNLGIQSSQAFQAIR